MPEPRIQGVDIAVATAEVNGAIPDRRRRKIEVERIGHGFSRRLGAVEMLAGVAPLAGGLELPLQLAGGGVDGVEVAIVAAKVNYAIRHGR